ncbi:hypothetical protein JCM3775_002930 [Rhodotorula graminis]|uniref:Uncharacterized protein n=1 Tax=Rhodotorula graminis (strain WP1) TaxID=578459 RepID=A0A194S5I0_RHOGW|nr:uncharacterized protein RHOBADRAFT_52862 [Rhodotorula graminis WP1]KPV75842.1 hypothetical protein RHOBADRAFT_52862 [Rhodotorula graminis WP1]
MSLVERGGAAAGDTSHNPATGTFDSVPPSSTYHGPKVAGTYGGFVGVFVASLFVALAVVAALIFLRLRTLRRRALRQDAVYSDARGAVPGRDAHHHHDDDEWNATEDAFEMPQRYDPMLGSAVSLVDDDGALPPTYGAHGGGGGSISQPRLYAGGGAGTDDGMGAAAGPGNASQDTLYGGGDDSQQRYRDPYGDDDGFRKH